MDTTVKPLVVAEITTDHLYNRWSKNNPKYDGDSLLGKEFHFDAMLDWWGWHYAGEIVVPDVRTRFKLYDDDGEHYYSGWLLNDDECIVQQFVLAWAKADSGCTTITIFKDTEAGYVQEIG